MNKARELHNSLTISLENVQLDLDKFVDLHTPCPQVPSDNQIVIKQKELEIMKKYRKQIDGLREQLAKIKL